MYVLLIGDDVVISLDFKRQVAIKLIVVENKGEVDTG